MPDDPSQLGLLPSREVLTVSGLNREARQAIERDLGTVWVEGEISNFARPASGHMYWSLKDASAQVRCAMFRQANRGLSFVPDSGMQVLVQARASLYEARGEFQLVVDYMEEAGEGVLRRRFEALKRKLEAEGLFDPARKKPIPILPARIGLITSPTGAAIRDVLIALSRRFPAIPVLVYPTSVQGTAAAEQIVAALRLAERRADCAVLILTRGGGSLEDLWPFNEEIVARAVAALSIPTIVGIGHETDFTIAEFAADLRAPTPSQAAELAVPDHRELLGRLSELGRRLNSHTTQVLNDQRRVLEALSHRLHREHPGMALKASQQRLDELEARMLRGLRQTTGETKRTVTELTRRLTRVDARQQIGVARARLHHAEAMAARLMKQSLAQYRGRIEIVSRSLGALGPQNTLDRGYAIVTRAADSAIIRHSTQVAPGEAVSIRLASGRVGATVQSVDDGE